MKNSSLVWSILVVALVIVVLVAWHPKAKTPVTIPVTTIAIAYTCDAGKTISSAMTDGGTTITLSDGRVLALTQATSASGVRYTNAGDTIEFWSKGDNAFLQENGTTTYDNCVAGSSQASGSGLKTFTDQGKTFSFQYPVNMTISGGGASYTADWLTNNPDQTLGLILAKATLAKSFQPQTNFSEATLMVSTSADAKAIAKCTTAQNGDVAAGSVVINGTTYSKFMLGDAGAGNLYDTTSYRTVKNSQCYAVSYTVHSTQIGNYDPSQGITAYDKDVVNNVLNAVVQSFKFL